ncbi:class I SAM-dependent DNA methyltransferase [Hyphomicrobium sp. DY-1]|uniref:class I SAM-dependent DNA methyltransferase n=1 Tax=Hyphomicrobium sp. DY-1 TaxID=3075650 RepID=UPI0039C16467
MNAVEIEVAVSELAAQPYARADFPYQFLTAFGFKETTVSKLRATAANTSDIENGVLLRTNIHLATADAGKANDVLAALKTSPKTLKGKVKFILATDGEMIEAEELATGEPLSCRYTDLPDHFGFFLPLAGISTVAEIKDNPIDIRATARLNKLYLELLKDNKDWATDKKRPALNQFMARLIFCFFAEDTGIFNHAGMFTECLRQMSEASSSNTHEVIEELFRAMNTAPEARKAANLKRWAEPFPYVNGGLFADDIGCPKFSKIARSYLLRAGDLHWEQINPDIFGSMIQAVADDDERGSLGMHYTSVPNILKVLDPLFLDDLRQQLEEAEDNPRKLLNLRKRIANIRVFDPACGSGNFLVIAYQKMREIEADIIKRRKDEDKKSWIKLTNFYGIEIKTFAAEIARLALLVAEFQENVKHIGQREACLDVLPLHQTGKIINDNALGVDWKEVCPPLSNCKVVEEDLAGPTGRMSFDGEPQGQTFICGNPPYMGRKFQSDEQKDELKSAFAGRSKDTLSLDYVTGWFAKAADYIVGSNAESAFVTTNSICQGIQVSALWPALFGIGVRISFAYVSFKWSNLASNKAGVTVCIVGLTSNFQKRRKIFEAGENDEITVRDVSNVNPYLIAGPDIYVAPRSNVPDDRTAMQFGNHPYYANALMLTQGEAREFLRQNPEAEGFVRPLYGSKEFIGGLARACIWITSANLDAAMSIPEIRKRVEQVRHDRGEVKKDAQAQKLVATPYRFRDQYEAKSGLIVVPIVSSEERAYLPVGVAEARAIVHNKAFALYDAPLWNLALIASRLHCLWIGTVCVRLEMRFSYSNTLGWNTFPVPQLTETDKADLTRCAEDILLAREAHFPKTIADVYDPDEMPADLRAAHDRNDETLERIYIGRRFRNDTERLEKLFDMYTKMTKDEVKTKKAGTRKNGKPAEEGEGA